jgi:DNA polymerase IV
VDERAGNRWVIHADLDAFFAAAAILRRPELAGLPVVVGGSPTGRGVVASASYEARAFGVRSAMPMSQALRLCPQAVIVGVEGAFIRELSHRFQAILGEFSPLVEVVSVDEAYLDAGGSERLFGGAPAIAAEIKRRVRQELGLVVSLGVATNRLVAKIASDLDKPDGLRIVPPGMEAATLAPLPVEKAPGIGPRSAARLRAQGIATLGQIAAASEGLLTAVVGDDAERLRRLARGEDDRPVRGERDERKSIGHERTFARDRRGLPELEAPLFDLCEETGMALRRQGLAGATVCLKLRYDDFTTITRQESLSGPTDAHQQFFATARQLLIGALHERAAPVRLIGVRVSGLSEPAMQLTLFDTRLQRTRQLNAALDRLADRAGARIVTPARYRVANAEC